MISYKLCGNVPNEQILTFYQKNHIDCFVHVSENEGLPISVAEAESAGIPIIATDVGGTKELLDGNGILLPADVSPEEVAEALKEVLTLSDGEKNRLSCKSRQIWEKQFNAKDNARRFVANVLPAKDPEIQNIVLITEGYPYIDSEKGFLEAELQELLKHFSVLIVACVSGIIDEKCEQNASRNLDNLLNVETGQRIKVVPYVETWTKLDLICSAVKFFFDKRTHLERRQIIGSQEKRIVRFWESIKYYGKAVKFFRWFMENETLNKYEFISTIIYTYWNLSPTLGICLNRDQIKDARVITRVHGYDYQDEQWIKSRRKPFTLTVDAFLDKIVFVCKDGMEYYLRKTGLNRDTEKYCYSYLGTNDAEKVRTDVLPEVSEESFPQNDYHRIVSCDALIPLKRVDKIVDALKILEERKSDLNIEWVHFGDGPLRMQLMEYIKDVFGREPN